MKPPRSRLWHRRVFRLVAFDRCRVAAPWFFWARARTPAAHLRRLACLLETNRLGRVPVWERTLAALLYLPLSLAHIVRALREHGPALRRAYGVSFPRQCAQLLRCAWRHGLRPKAYYYLRLHREPVADYLDPAELHFLQRAINTAPIHQLEDKVAFHRTAAAGGLPLIPLLALFDHGQLCEDARRAVSDSWQQDLIAKPASGYSSQGLRGFRFQGQRHVCVTTGREFNTEELTRELLAASAHAAILLQPWVRNHPRVAGFSTGALCNFRVVTARVAEGEPEIVMAALRFPLRSELTCAERDVTLCAAVDFSTGMLSAAEAKDPAIGRLTVHPVTRQRIEGFVVESWPEIRALVLRSHREFPGFPFIGWDVADSTQGITLLEGSSLWGGFLAQMSGSAPLGTSRFAALYLENLRALESAPRRQPALVAVP